jgi:photosystem II stability/assembly factor-like uncharacterized protein
MRILFTFLVITFISVITIAQPITWAPTGFNYGGKVYALITANDRSIIAGKENKVFRSTDYGLSWTQTESNLNESINCFTKKTINGYLFAGTSTGTDTSRGGVYRSTDNGLNWSIVGLKGRRISTMTVALNGAIFTGSNGDSTGIYKSPDNGITWTSSGLKTYDIYTLTCDLNGNLFAGTGNDCAIFKSIDNGNNWTQLSNWGQTGTVRSIAVNATGTLYAVLDGIGQNGLYISNDNGLNWILKLPNIEYYNSPPILINSNQVGYIATTGQGIFQTLDGGTNWAPTNLEQSNLSIYSLTIDDKNYIYGGSNGSIFKSNIPIYSGDSASCITWKAMPELKTLRLGSRGVVYNNQRYCIGGYNAEKFLNSTELFDGTQWIYSKDMKEKRAQFACGVLNNKIFVFGGANSSSEITNTFEYYDGTGWEIADTIPVALTDCDGEVFGDSFYLFGGIMKFDKPYIYNNDLWKFDEVNGWNKLRSLPFIRTGYSTVIINDTIYVIGGASALPKSGSINFYTQVYRYIISNNTIDSIAPLNIPRADFSAEVINGKIYVIGGTNNGEPFISENSIEIYDPNTKIWSKCLDFPDSVSSSASLVFNNSVNLYGGTGLNTLCYSGGDIIDAVPENIKNLHLNINPNPVLNYISINISQKAKIEILNIEGHIIKTFDSDNKELTIDLSDLTMGVYFIKAKANKEIIIEKFIKE